MLSTHSLEPTVADCREAMAKNMVARNSLEGYTKRDLSLDPLTEGR